MSEAHPAERDPLSFAMEDGSRAGGGDDWLPPDPEEPDPHYREALEWVWSFSARPRSPEEMAQQRATRLTRMAALLRSLGDPQHAFPAVLVAGTKGKGSVVAMVAACLHAAGARVGWYTSPHLVNWRERTRVGRRAIGADDVLSLVPEVRRATERLPRALGHLSTFEVGTAIALAHFARSGVEVAVVEVGVGGEHDATNVLDPLVSAITPISFDHTATLGPTLADIAREKAGVMRPGRPVVLGLQAAEALGVLDARGRSVGARVVRVGRDWRWRQVPASAGAAIAIEPAEGPGWGVQAVLPLAGEHQCDNAATAVAILAELWRARTGALPPADVVRLGLETVEWPGRLQVVQKRPLVVLDGAHNAASAQAVARAVATTYRFDRLHLVLGVTAGKDVAGIVEALVPLAHAVTLTRSHHERAVDPAELRRRVGQLYPRAATRVAGDLPTALQRALGGAREGDLVLVAGSLFLVGEALVWAHARTERSSL